MKTVLFVFLSFSFLAQKYEPFEGKLVYSIEMADTSLHKFRFVKIEFNLQKENWKKKNIKLQGQ